MPKAWRKTKAAKKRRTEPTKKRRAASGPLLFLPRIAPRSRRQIHGFGIRRQLLLPSSPSPSPIVPSVAAPASGSSLVVTQGPARASLSTGDSHVVAPCSIEGTIAFANFADANHPFQAYLRSLPDRSSIFDSSVLDIDMVISHRAPLTLRYFHLWRRLRGQTSNTTLAIALWERHHWVANSAVERMFRAMFRDPSFNKEVVKAILQQWKVYIKFRKQRADVLWIHHKRSFQGEWLVDEQDNAEELKELPP
ncbi:hypothetical protein JG688_00018426, partial [Phytophthora aleatoria]